MLKLTDSTTFDGEMNISVVTPSYFQTLEKTAASEEVGKYIGELLKKTNPNKAYFHINAMGAGEYYGSNRNGDYFPEEQLLKYYHTFVSNPAHLFRHHINKDPSIANGVVIFAAYNHDMHRVELIAEADKELVKDIEARIAAGDYPSTSMACKTPFDVCSICGNVAHSRGEYCTHLLGSMNQVLPDGRKVSALNLGPLSFFDISVVLKGADPTSYILTKVAGEDRVLGSAERAELEKLADHQKKAKFTKISELVKEVDSGLVTGVTIPVDPLPQEILLGLAQDSWENITEAFKETKVLPSLLELASLYYLKHGMTPDIELLQKLIKQDPKLPVPEPDDSESGTGIAKVLLKRAMFEHGMDYDNVSARAMARNYSGDAYINTAPPLYYPGFQEPAPLEKKPPLLTRLFFAISALGAAVAAYRAVYSSLRQDPFTKRAAEIKLKTELR